jgi:DNA-binding NarL/FixJ family response regulator
MNKIILADNQELFRIGMVRILASEKDFHLVAQYADLERLLLSMDAYRSSIVVFASALRPEYPDLMPRVKAAGSRAIVIAENGESAHSFIAHGIRGVVYRNTAGQELAACVQAVIRGDWSIQRAGEASGFDEEATIGMVVRDRLAPKEMQVVALVVQDFKNKEIAHRLGTTEQVIKNYLRNIYQKTGASNRVELALFTAQNRILVAATAQAGTLVWEPGY